MKGDLIDIFLMNMKMNGNHAFRNVNIVEFQVRSCRLYQDPDRDYLNAISMKRS